MIVHLSCGCDVDVVHQIGARSVYCSEHGLKHVIFAHRRIVIHYDAYTVDEQTSMVWKG
jgi:hypothetical protein